MKLCKVCQAHKVLCGYRAEYLAGFSKLQGEVSELRANAFPNAIWERVKMGTS